MNKERLEYIKKNVDQHATTASEIMEGGDNYNGADGARIVITVCCLAEELIAEIERGAPPVWFVLTKDKRSDDYYRVGGEFESFGDARRFAVGCLRSRRKLHVHVVRRETSY
jgi:hypothetical protein